MGVSKSTTIEINGKRYDARTGELARDVKSAVNKAKTAANASTAVRTVSDIARRPAAVKPRRAIQRSQTLMRGAVKRPVKPATVNKVKTKQVSDIQPVRKPQFKPLTTTNDAARLNRAQQIQRNKLVSKFAGQKQPSPAPIQTAPVENRVANLPVQPAPVLKHSSKVESVLERGLKNAQSHNQTLDKKTAKKTRSKRKGKSRLAGAAAGTLAVLLLGGFFTYQNIPNISMRYAAARSGVHASLPGYKPAGFALSNHIQYNPGQITVNFKSNADERAFSITQRETAWNSDALLSNYVTTKTDQVHKYEDKGRTIFLYGDNNATWVNGGVWYDIEGDSNLNSDQLIRIATSM